MTRFKHGKSRTTPGKTGQTEEAGRSLPAINLNFFRDLFILEARHLMLPLMLYTRTMRHLVDIGVLAEKEVIQ